MAFVGSVAAETEIGSCYSTVVNDTTADVYYVKSAGPNTTTFTFLVCPFSWHAFDSVPVAAERCKLMEWPSYDLAELIIFSEFLGATVWVRYLMSEALVFMDLLKVAELFWSLPAKYSLSWSEC